MSLKIGKKYLFDTSVFIHALRGNSPKGQAAQQLMLQSGVFGISVGYSILTEVELWVGIQLSTGWSEKQHKAILNPFKRYFLNVNIARRAGEMRGKLTKAGLQKTQGPQMTDCIIAATAEYYDLIIVTDNMSDFAEFGRLSVASINTQSY